MFDNLNFDTGWQLAADRRNHHREVADWRSAVARMHGGGGARRDATRARRGRGLTSPE